MPCKLLAAAHLISDVEWGWDEGDLHAKESGEEDGVLFEETLTKTNKEQQHEL